VGAAGHPDAAPVSAPPRILLHTLVPAEGLGSAHEALADAGVAQLCPGQQLTVEGLDEVLEA